MKRGIALYGASYGQAVRRAREFRQAQTRSEAVLWQALRARAVGGLKFRRQHPVGPFFLDFYCPSLKLALEVDGPIHAGQVRRDILRQRLIEELGIRFLRLTSAEVENNLELALHKIRRAATQGPISSHPFSASGEGAGG